MPRKKKRPKKDRASALHPLRVAPVVRAPQSPPCLIIWTSRAGFSGSFHRGQSLSYNLAALFNAAIAQPVFRTLAYEPRTPRTAKAAHRRCLLSIARCCCTSWL
jgi:hypothetical protein